MNWRILTYVMAFASVPTWAVAQDTAVSPQSLSGPAWSPYLVGALIGVLTMLTFYFSDKPLGASTAYARLAGLIGKAVAPRHTQSLKYFQDNRPMIDWEVILVAGAIAGAMLAAWHGGEFTNEWLPALWSARFGDASGVWRAVAALGGGVFMAFGARMAGGCTSGHGISGTLQLSVGSWIAVICFFVSGITLAMAMFRW